MSDFVYDTMQDRFWCLLDLRLRTPEAVDAMVPMHEWKQGYDGNNKPKLLRPSVYLRRVENDSVVEGSTWWPGQGRIIHDVVVTEEGVLHVPGARCLNTFRAPAIRDDGDPAIGAAWADFLADLFGTETAEFLVRYFAHLVQRPHEKCNTIIAMTGDQGVGKDTALEAIRNIVGTWNCREISPDMLFESFDPWKQSLLLVINEARPQNSEHMQWQFYEKLKVLGAAPPHWLHVNAKFERLRYVRNTMRTVITFNKLESLYIPEDDRRVFIARAQREPGWLTTAARDAIHDLVRNGSHHVAAFLAAQDLSDFDPFAPPPRSDGWQVIASSWNEREGDELYEALSELQFPAVVFSSELLTRTNIGGGLDTHKELARRIRSAHFVANMERLGYRVVLRPKGRREWRFGGSDSPHAIRARTAFLRKDQFSDDPQENLRVVEAHGRALAKIPQEPENES